MSKHDETMFEQAVGPLLIVLSGPSGVGKDAVLSLLKHTERGIRFITTLTTRPRRQTETDGIDYRFVSVEEYQGLLDRDEMLESAKVYNNWYGVPKQPIRTAFREGKDVVVKVDVQGAATIKKLVSEAVFIFLMPPSLEELARRLTQRYTEKPPELELRLKTAESELNQVPMFDYSVVNNSGGIEAAASQIKAIITAEKCRVRPRNIVIP